MTSRRASPSEVKPLTTMVPRFWRPSALAPHLGLSRQTVYKLLKNKTLECVELEGAKRIPEASILAYLEKARAKAAVKP